jgi:plastocyanin
MAPSRRGSGRRRHGRWLLLLALAGVGAFQLAAVSLANETIVEPFETTSGFTWRPAAVSAAPGGTVAFRNPGYIVPHGVHWTGGPEKPSCSGVPVDSSGTSWSGTCGFAQAGTYTFVCTVHPEEMKGTITVASGEAPPGSPVPVPVQPPDSPQGPGLEGLRLARLQRGDAVRGSLIISAGAAGGRLTVELRARRASLGAGSAGTVRVGHLRRSPLEAGRQSFQIPIQAPALRALRQRGRLAAAVKIIVTAPSGSTTTVTRGVVLHG